MGGKEADWYSISTNVENRGIDHKSRQIMLK